MFNRILLAFSVILIVSGLVLVTAKIYQNKINFLSPVINDIETKILPLAKYSIENLKTGEFPPQNITIAGILQENPEYKSRLFIMSDKNSSVSGLMNIPENQTLKGVVVLLRGYVDREIFTTGTGTKRIGEKLAENGFLTLAPDFLGYGKSTNPSALPMEERFQTYTTVLSLLASIPNLKSSLSEMFPGLDTSLISENVALFGHSNGGHIALAVLEITGKKYPTVLWAPVSKPFPYSILAYTDEYEDKGKAMRKLVSEFEKDYDVDKYSIDNYFADIASPLSVHQGLADQEVPYWWSDEFVSILKSKDKDVEYFKYPGEDHNFNAGTWPTLAERTVNFYVRQFLKH